MRYAALVTLLLALPNAALAWGAQGHRVVATLASQRLTPAARAQVEELLRDNPDGTTLAAVSSWADEVRYGKYPETTNWHFVDIPLSSDEYRPERDCQDVPGKGACVIAALARLRPVLADRTRPHRDRVEALEFIVHLVADMHQPLHAAERDDDRGATRVTLTWFGRETWGREHRPWSLHGVWDEGLIRETKLSDTKYVVRLNAWLAKQNSDAIAAGTTVDWALEAHRLARVAAYRDFDGHSIPPRGARLGSKYYEARIGAVDQQLARASVRLARVLNEALAPAR